MFMYVLHLLFQRMQYFFFFNSFIYTVFSLQSQTRRRNWRLWRRRDRGPSSPGSQIHTMGPCWAAATSPRRRIPRCGWRSYPSMSPKVFIVRAWRRRELRRTQLKPNPALWPARILWRPRPRPGAKRKFRRTLKPPRVQWARPRLQAILPSDHFSILYTIAQNQCIWPFKYTFVSFDFFNKTPNIFTLYLYLFCWEIVVGSANHSGF
jgi:hypothetical protein